jgi:hypothetical protein
MILPADAPPVRVRREVADVIGWSPTVLRELEAAGIVQIVEQSSAGIRL